MGSGRSVYDLLSKILDLSVVVYIEVYFQSNKKIRDPCGVIYHEQQIKRELKGI